MTGTGRHCDMEMKWQCEGPPQPRDVGCSALWDAVWGAHTPTCVPALHGSVHTRHGGVIVHRRYFIKDEFV